MSILYNRISQKELKEKLLQSNEARKTVSFYHYFKINEPQQFRDELFKNLFQLQVFGRIYVAHEGINAQISVAVENFDAFKNYINSIEPLNGIRLNVAIDDNGKSFWVLKVKVRNKIVADGINDATFNMEHKGKYLKANEYNELAEKPDTIIVDMRNHYEYEVGHFKNAIEVPSETFKQQLPMAVDILKDAKDKNIIMYCTGGIRCEKASAYMLHNGFKNVFHVEGGIIEYSNKAKELGIENKFIGKNFVFDERLGERITNEIISQCHQCGKPADTHINCINQACHLLFIQCHECAEKYNQCCSIACKDVVALPEEIQKELRKGVDKGKMINHRSKNRLNDLKEKGNL
ncbi:MAG: hypothetical protein RL708_1567 [Bacteroidota bacterium]|jgi:UPF0176 protein